MLYKGRWRTVSRWICYERGVEDEEKIYGFAVYDGGAAICCDGMQEHGEPAGI